MRISRRSLIRWKVYFDRSKMYIGYVQFLLIGVVFIQSFRDHPLGELIFRYAIIAFPLLLVSFIAVSLFLGYVDSKLGLMEEEMRNLSASNPVTMEILQRVNELKKEIEQLKDRLPPQ